MPKVFNVDQLRIKGSLLTGNAAGTQLFYNGQQIAQGGSAVPTEREITLGAGISYSDDSDVKDLSTNLNIVVRYDGEDSASAGTIGVNASDQLYVKNAAIDFQHLSSNVAGPGLLGGDTDKLSVNGGSGITVSSDAVNIGPLGVKNSMLEGNIGNSKLDTIVTNDKVQGNAVTRDDTTIVTGDGGVLKVGTVAATNMGGAIAGNGLQLSSSAIDIVPAVGSGISVSASEIGITPLGVTNGMLAGNIANSKLDDLTDSSGGGMVYGQAIRKDSSLDSTANELHIADQGVQEKHIHADVAGNGLTGGNNNPLSVVGGSGITSNAAGTHISETGIVTSMIKDGQITDAKVGNGEITLAKTAIVGGSGIVLNTNNIDIGAGDGIDVGADAVAVDNTVVRTNGTQTLNGDYTFGTAGTVTFDTGIVVKGDLEVQGDTILVDSQTVNIGDNIIVLNADQAGAGAGPDAGLEIERGSATDNAYLLFDDDGSDVWKIGMAPAAAGDPSASLYQVHSAQYTRSYSVEVASGDSSHALAFGHTFGSLPNVTVSLQHTGVGGVSNPDLLGAMVTGLYTTGVHVAFTAGMPHSGYYLNVQASTI